MGLWGLGKGGGELTCEAWGAWGGELAAYQLLHVPGKRDDDVEALQ